MTNALSPIITEQGLQAVFNATNDGFAARITHVALGDQGYSVPVNTGGHTSQMVLGNERQRVNIADARADDPHQIYLSFVAVNQT